MHWHSEIMILTIKSHAYLQFVIDRRIGGNIQVQERRKLLHTILAEKLISKQPEVTLMSHKLNTQECVFERG